MIHIVTDSTADVDAATAAQLGVTVVPLIVRFGDLEFRDGVDINAADFYARLTAGSVQPSTSQPSPEAFASVYRDLLKDPNDVVLSIHISAALSGTLQSATLAAQEFGDRVYLFDTRTVSGGVQHFVRAAAAEAAAGNAIEAIVSELTSMLERSHLFILFDTLTYLHRGGRIGGAQAFVGGVLGVKPLLQIRDGRVEPHSRVRSRQKGLAALVEIVKGLGKMQAIEVMQADALATSAELHAQLDGLDLKVPVAVGEMGPVVGVYAGPGTVGVAVVTAK